MPPRHPADPLRRRLLKTGAASAGLMLAPGMAMAAPVPWRIVTTTGQVADMMRAVAGDRATVENLLGEGIDPHTYKLTRSDVAKLMAADIVAYNGLLLEGKITDALRRVADAGRPVLAVAEMVDPARLLSPAEFQGQHDPHVWMDVGLWATAADGVRDRLSWADPSWTENFRANADLYRATLMRLDDRVRDTLGTIPAERRVLVTAHDAFNYLGRAYGLDVIGIQGLSTESEAGLRRIEELVTLLVERRIPAVFVESSVSERNVAALVAGAAARGHEVAIGGRLYSDAMGPAGTHAGTYVGMIEHNAITIARALGGRVPGGGFAGRAG